MLRTEKYLVSYHQMRICAQQSCVLKDVAARIARIPSILGKSMVKTN